MQPKASCIRKFRSILERIYSTYLDCVNGFENLSDSASVFYSPEIPVDPERDEHGRSPAGVVIYKLGEMETGDYVELSARTAVRMYCDNRPDGRNTDLAGQMFLVAAYQYLEHQYRSLIAKDLGIPTQELKVYIFGDMRLLRNSIIHDDARWSKDLEKLHLVKFESDGVPDDKLVFTQELMKFIWWQAHLALKDLDDQITGGQCV